VRAQHVVEGASRGVRRADRGSRARLGVWVRRYDGVRRVRDALERGTRWHARRRAFWHEMLQCR
jgi:hypothetical protein